MVAGPQDLHLPLGSVTLRYIECSHGALLALYSSTTGHHDHSTTPPVVKDVVGFAPLLRDYLQRILLNVCLVWGV